MWRCDRANESTMLKSTKKLWGRRGIHDLDRRFRYVVEVDSHVVAYHTFGEAAQMSENRVKGIVAVGAVSSSC